MIRRSESTKFLAAALVQWQKNMPVVVKDARNPHFGNKFASLGTLIHAAAPTLAECGLCVTQFPTTVEDQPALCTVLLHVSGEFMEDVMSLALTKPGAQEQGSGLTYARRYAYCAVLGIVADEDDDAERAVSPASTPARHASRPDAVAVSDSQVTISRQMYQQVNGEDIPLDVPMETQRSHTSTLATPKQATYCKALLLGAGLNDEEKLTAWFAVNDLGAWPGGVNNLSKTQAQGVIERLKP